MTRKRIFIWLTLAALPVAIVAVALFWPRTPALPPQILKMPDGTVYEFVGVTCGTNHVLGSLSAKIVHRFPAFMANLARKILGARLTQVDGARSTTQPSLLVWFKVSPANPSPRSPGLQMVRAKIADEHDVESGTQAYVSLQSGFGAVGDFPILPRRSRMLQLTVYESDDQEQILGEIGRVKFPNPVFGKFPQWQPDTGPNVRKAGDLEVRLDNFFVGKRLSGRPVWTSSGQSADYRPAEWGERAETVFDFSLRSPEGGNESWILQNAQLSDATGNVLENPRSITSASVDGLRIGLSPISGVGSSRRSLLPGALWPDELAWKLKLEFKRASGFASNELVTFKQVPIPAPGTTNKPNLSLRAGDVQLVLTEFVWTGSQAIGERTAGGFRTISRFRLGPGTQIRVELPGHPEGVSVDLIRMATDTGNEVQPTVNGWQPGVRTVSLVAISTNAHTVDITFVVQKTRAVEFLLKLPQK